MGTERVIERLAVKELEAEGWLVRLIQYRGRRGSVDMLAAKGGVIKLIEFKDPTAPRGDRETRQDQERERLIGAGLDVHVCESVAEVRAACRIS